MLVVVNASVTVTVTDSNGANVSVVLNLNIDNGALTINTASLPDGTVGVAYSEGIQVSGGTPPYTFAADGLPTGLTIDPGSGMISGTPTGN
jgi:hypothetical protein